MSFKTFFSIWWVSILMMIIPMFTFILVYLTGAFEFFIIFPFTFIPVFMSIYCDAHTTYWHGRSDGRQDLPMASRKSQSNGASWDHL